MLIPLLQLLPAPPPFPTHPTFFFLSYPHHLGRVVLIDKVLATICALCFVCVSLILKIARCGIFLGTVMKPCSVVTEILGAPPLSRSSSLLW